VSEILAGSCASIEQDGYSVHWNGNLNANEIRSEFYSQIMSCLFRFYT
jgi:hypothetical protein